MQVCRGNLTKMAISSTGAIFPPTCRSARSWPSIQRPWVSNPSRPALPGSALGRRRQCPSRSRFPRMAPRGAAKAPRPRRPCSADPKVLKLFHFGRFDIAVLEHALGVRCEPVYCTKIAAKLARTFTDRFGLKDLCRELLGVDLVQAAADLRLGRRQPDRRAACLRGFGRAHLHRAEGQARRCCRREGRPRTGRRRASSSCPPARASTSRGWPETGYFRTLKYSTC